MPRWLRMSGIQRWLWSHRFRGARRITVRTFDIRIHKVASRFPPIDFYCSLSSSGRQHVCDFYLWSRSMVGVRCNSRRVRQAEPINSRLRGAKVRWAGSHASVDEAQPGVLSRSQWCSVNLTGSRSTVRRTQAAQRGTTGQRDWLRSNDRRRRWYGNPFDRSR